MAAVAVFALLSVMAPTARASALGGTAKATGWSVEGTSVPGALDSDSCVTSDFCIAVGNLFNRSGTAVAGAEVWNGSAWTVQKTPHPVVHGGESSELNGVSCASATACMAVGDVYTNNAADDLSLAEFWNGTAWRVLPTANPKGSTEALLFSVSCTSPTACTATGWWGGPSVHEDPLAESWNGTTWTLNQAPAPSGSAYSSLYGVSCSSPTACTAVGYASGVSLIETWNGKAWSIAKSPNPAGDGDTNLAAVSCASTIACTAVGAFTPAYGAGVTVVEVWNGEKWSIVPTPNVKGATSTGFEGVSCTTPTSCTAVGDYETRGKFTTMLAASGTGSVWKLQTPESVVGDTWLDGVACQAAGVCQAVGVAATGSGPSTVTEGEGTT